MSDEGLTLVPMPDSTDRPSMDDDDETSALAGRTTGSSSSLLRSPGGSTPGRSRSIRWVEARTPPQPIDRSARRSTSHHTAYCGLTVADRLTSVCAARICSFADRSDTPSDLEEVSRAVSTLSSHTCTSTHRL